MFDKDRVSAAVGSQPTLMRQIAGHPHGDVVRTPDAVEQAMRRTGAVVAADGITVIGSA